MYVCMYVCTYVCMYVCICMYGPKHTHTLIACTYCANIKRSNWLKIMAYA